MARASRCGQVICPSDSTKPAWLRSSGGADRSNDEFAGSTFSPDGHTLFVNIQAGAGMNFAIWGPWERIGV